MKQLLLDILSIVLGSIGWEHNVTKGAESVPPKIKTQDGTRGRHVNLWTKCDMYNMGKYKVPCGLKNGRLLLGEERQQKRCFKETELALCTNG